MRLSELKSIESWVEGAKGHGLDDNEIIDRLGDFDFIRWMIENYYWPEECLIPTACQEIARNYLRKRPTLYAEQYRRIEQEMREEKK